MQKPTKVKTTNLF